jgi:hypothetical protein
MPDLRVRRTLVKSPPELWAELSEVEGLARHLEEFGEITITKAEPETTVAWEGDSASGIVELEPTGWGTKVTITVQVPEPEEPVLADAADGEPDPFETDPDPFDPAPEALVEEPAETYSEPEPEPAPEPRRGIFSRWLFRERRSAPEAEPQAIAAGPALEPEAAPPEPDFVPIPAAERHEAAVPPFEGPDEDFEFEFAIRRGSAEEQAAAEEQTGPVTIEPGRAREILETALENLGQAHHRPFSRG